MGFDSVHCHLDAFETRLSASDLSKLKQLLLHVLAESFVLHKCPSPKNALHFSDVVRFCQVGVWLYIYLAVIIEEVPLPNIGTS